MTNTKLGSVVLSLFALLWGLSGCTKGGKSDDGVSGQSALISNGVDDDADGETDEADEGQVGANCEDEDEEEDEDEDQDGDQDEDNDDDGDKDDDDDKDDGDDDKDDGDDKDDEEDEGCDD